MNSAMNRDWFDLSYLQLGTRRQKDAFHVLDSLGIFAKLGAYHPVLAGTIPLDIDVDTSDLDLIFFAEDLDRFEQIVKEEYGHLDHFAQARSEVHQVPTSITSFLHRNFWLELFAQPVPVTRQNAYRHMVIEAKLLELAGHQAAQDIRALKERGMKTEPAFAYYFRLPGKDPYLSLLDVEMKTEEEWRQLVNKRRKHLE
ncbi:DUF4269 domain-containing protein [Brevibacillus borstelensis]|uniref:DUF4269 domain-containing protein n=1 Tax=Brevibacillus borstelensis TaxID=45462 RepID=UPI0030BC3F87